MPITHAESKTTSTTEPAAIRWCPEGARDLRSHKPTSVAPESAVVLLVHLTAPKQPCGAGLARAGPRASRAGASLTPEALRDFESEAEPHPRVDFALVRFLKWPSLTTRKLTWSGEMSVLSRPEMSYLSSS
eukprot:7878799-Pyramimonas_sp.AAC.1